jgi:glycosyltransferase involved in cell wall biosynthesis
MISRESDCDLSLVVPVYRNRETLRELRDRVQRVCQQNGWSHELVFVDDACPDGSFEVLQRLVQEVPQTTVLQLRRNVGQHAAVLAGLAHCRGRWVVIMDADLQDPPEAIPRLLQAAQAETTAVFAGRRGRYESSLRLWSSRIFKWLLHLACGVPADAGIFVALRSELVQELVRLRTRRPSIVAMIGCTSRNMISVPVERSRRPRGSSAYSSWGRWKSALRALLCVFEHSWFPPPLPYLQAHDPVARRLDYPHRRNPA